MISQKLKKVQHKLIIVLPRAVDIPLTCAATLSKYAKNDWKIVAVITTSENRENEKHELAQSGKIIGLAHAYFLKYKTGNLKQAGADNPKMDIYEIFQEEKPDVILTVARHGFSQNPDATTTSIAAILAYEKYIKNIIPETPAAIPTASHVIPVLPVPKLYFYCLPEQFLSFIQSKGFLRKDSAGFNFEGTPDKKITHVIDGKIFAKQKIEALRIHKSAQIETSRMIELLKTYKSSHMDYFMKYPLVETDKISSRL